MLRHYFMIFSTLVCLQTYASNSPRPQYEVPTKSEEPEEERKPTPTTADSFDLKEPNKVYLGTSDYFPTSFDEIKFMPGVGREASGFYSLMRMEAGFAQSNYSSWTIGADIQFRGQGSISFEHTWRIFERGWFPFFDLGLQLGINPNKAFANFLGRDNLYIYGSAGLEKFVTTKNKIIFQVTLGASLETVMTTFCVGYTFPL